MTVISLISLFSLKERIQSVNLLRQIFESYYFKMISVYNNLAQFGVTDEDEGYRALQRLAQLYVMTNRSLTSWQNALVSLKPDYEEWKNSRTHTSLGIMNAPVFMLLACDDSLYEQELKSFVSACKETLQVDLNSDNFLLLGVSQTIDTRGYTINDVLNRLEDAKDAKNKLSHAVSILHDFKTDLEKNDWAEHDEIDLLEATLSAKESQIFELAENYSTILEFIIPIYINWVESPEYLALPANSQLVECIDFHHEYYDIEDKTIFLINECHTIIEKLKKTDKHDTNLVLLDSGKIIS